MTLTHPKLYILLLALAMIAFSACNDDDDDSDDMTPELSTEELLIGEWETTNVDVSTSIGNQTVAEYLVTEVGLSPLEAEARERLLIDYLKSELNVTLIMNADHTYESMHANGMDSGTWSLSADEKVITLIEAGEKIVFTIVSISTEVLNAIISDQIEYDIDDDENTPDVSIDAEALVTMEK